MHNLSLNEVFRKKNDVVVPLLSVAYEFGLSYKDIVSLPLPAYLEYLKMLDMMHKDVEKEMRRVKKR